MSALRKSLLAMSALVLLIPVSSAAAEAAPAWQVGLIPMPTNLQPATEGSGIATASIEAPFYRFTATNVGGRETEGAITFTVIFPAEVIPLEDETQVETNDQQTPNPTCTTSGQELTCTTPGPLWPGRALAATIPVAVAAGASGTLEAYAAISGGGAQAVSMSAPSQVASPPPPFGLLQGSTGLQALLTNDDGSSSSQAGSHPDQMTFNLAFPTENEKIGPLQAAGHVRDVITDLPQGLVVNPNATPARCTETEFLSGQGASPGCPNASQIGIVTVTTEIAGPKFPISALYNMVPPPGMPAEVAFNALEIGIFVHLKGGLRTEDDYGITATTTDTLARTNNPLLNVQVQLWGDPSGASHDEIRGACRLNSSSGDTCPISRQEKPLITMPSACSGPLQATVSADSWENPGSFDSRSTQFADPTGSPTDVSGCSNLEFAPALTLTPEASTAETPTGVDVHLHVPQNADKDEAATSNLRDIAINFPPGMAVNPAAADGLAACSPAQIGLKTGMGETPIHFTAAAPSCPAGSRIGSVEVKTPLLDHPVPGSVYVAEPFHNPFGTLLGTYVVIESPDDGLIVKLAGETEANPQTGQISVAFNEAPELPFEDFDVHLFGGPRAVLRTPSTCGTFTTETSASPWSGTAPVAGSDSFSIGSGANGGPCAAHEAESPAATSFSAGTATPIAATYSPFLTRLQRADGTQPLKGLELKLPPGLSGKLAGIPACAESALIAAAKKTGAAELASPSCPAASQIGAVQVGAGAGPAPYYTSGKVYLAGPYQGAPFSIAVLTPAVAGPFDLGTVVTRAGLRLDPITTAVSVKSDPLPQILQGIPLQIRDVRVDMNRPDFTLNPTSCDEKAIVGTATSVFEQTIPLSQRFQVGGCSGLAFKPKLSLNLKGKTRRTSHPTLIANLTAKPGEANIARAQVKLPKAAFLDNAHIGTICTNVQFKADTCPSGSIYGKASATSPLLGYEVAGPVYLRSSTHQLPDLVVKLKGPASQPIEVDLAGKTDSVKGALRNTFEAVPDAPVSQFHLELFGGKKGLIILSAGLCKSPKAQVQFDGQNGRVFDSSPVVKTSCPKKHKKHKRRR